MVQYKLTYFNARGRAETVRMIFAVAKQEFVDERIEREAWPALKPKAPLGQMPYLEIKEEGKPVVYISQSMTIARYLAKKFNLLGKDDLEQAFTEMFADQCNDLQNAMISAYLEKDEARKKEMNERIQTETLPNNLKMYENRLKNNGGYLSGSSMTYADLHLFSILNWLSDIRATIFQTHPNLKAFYEKVENVPSIKDYLARRSKTEL